MGQREAQRTAAANDLGALPLPRGVLSEVTRIPVATLVSATEHEAAQSAAAPETLPSRSKLAYTDGKAYILYMGAEYCPYCAAERWPMVMALAKFGTFSDLKATSSSPDDVDPSTPTFSFYGATYASRFVSLDAVELFSNKMSSSSGSYAVLRVPTKQEFQLLTEWDKPPYTSAAGGIPFVYIAGRYLITAAQYDAGQISHWRMAKAAAYMTAGNNSTSRAAEAAAGYLVGDICSLTHDQPASVCSAVPARLKGGGGRGK